MTTVLTAANEDAGTRLDAFLAARLPELSHVVTSFAYYFNVVVYHRNNGTGKIDFALLPETGIKVAISLQIRYDVGKIFPFPKVWHCEPVLGLARQSVS